MNQVLLVASVGRIDEQKITTKSGDTMQIARFSMNPKREENKAHDFPRCRIIGKMAENFLKFRKEGDKALIRGVIETGTYEKDGETVSTAEVFVTSWEFADANAPDVNIVMLSGNLTRDPFEPSDKVQAFTIGVTRERDPEKSDFPRIVNFKEKLDVAKGDKVMIIGRFQTGSYEKDGKKVYTNDIAVTGTGKAEILQKAGGGKSNAGNTGSSTAPAEAAPNGWVEENLEDVPF